MLVPWWPGGEQDAVHERGDNGQFVVTPHSGDGQPGNTNAAKSKNVGNGLAKAPSDKSREGRRCVG